ncbi:DUF4278 domain-containing protein [Myxosarcina sp. GI1(2024)]
MQLTYRGNAYNHQLVQIAPSSTLEIAGKYRGVSSQINLGTQLVSFSTLVFKYRGVNYIKKTISFQDMWEREKLQPILV